MPRPAPANPTPCPHKPHFSSQARDRWSNNLWESGFNVTAELYLAEGGLDQNLTAAARNETGGSNWDPYPSGEPWSATFLTNGSGMALVAYVPKEAGTSLLYGERTKNKQKWSTVVHTYFVTYSLLVALSPLSCIVSVS